MKIALGSMNAAKTAAVRAAARRIAQVDAGWARAVVITRAVTVSVPAMPLSDAQLMRGSRERADSTRQALQTEGLAADYYIGLEGGFHSLQDAGGAWVTFLRGWAYVTDGTRGFYGVTPSVTVPDALARRVTEGGLELSTVIDEAAGEHDVRNRQGAWGVLSRDLLTRSESFAAALIAACAPFYNAKFYT